MIFSKLPTDIINIILLYDEHFIMRKGKIVSIIPKSDMRYKILSFITLNAWNFSEFNFKRIYNYKFNNVYNGDLIKVSPILFGLENNIQNHFVIKNNPFSLKVQIIVGNT